MMLLVASSLFVPDFGFGKTSMSSIIAEEAGHMVQQFLDRAGEDFCIDQTFNICVFNIIWRLVAGKRFKVQY